MSELKMPVAAKGERPYFLDDKDAEKAMNMVLALTGELSVVYARLYAMERVLEKHGLVAPGEVGQYKVTAEDEARLDRWRNDLIKIILRPIHAEMERNAQPNKEPYQKAIEIAEG